MDGIKALIVNDLGFETMIMCMASLCSRILLLFPFSLLSSWLIYLILLSLL